MELNGKVAIITGGSRGMGLEIAKMLAAEGVRLALVARNPERLAAAVEQIKSGGGEVIGVPTDIREITDVEKMAQKVVDTYGTIDILVNSAFWGPPGSIEETDEALWDQTLDTCLKGAFLCTRAVAPTLQAKRSGRVINIGSLAGKVGEDNRTAYCAAKWGLEGLTAALRVELGKDDIHVNLISPAATDTPWWREVGANLTPQVLERMIPAEVIAETVRWVLKQPDRVYIPDVPVYNFKNPFEGKGSPFES
jgi:3-oxoacyl-[acyl-carrier protein] reductase